MDTQELPTIEQIVAGLKTSSDKTGQEPVEEAAPGEGVEAKAEEAAAAPEVKEEAAAEEAVEAKEEEAKEEPKEEKKDSFSKKFAAITRREKEARQRQAEVDRRAKELEAKMKELEERESRWSSTVKKSPYKAIKEAGLTLQDIMNDSLNQYEAPKEDPVASKFDEMANEIKKLTEKLNQYETQTSEREYRQAIREVEDSIQEVIRSNPEKYELAAQFGQEAVDLAKEIMSEFYRVHQRVLDYSELCDMVELSYEDEVLNRIVNTNKVKSRFSSSKPDTKSAPPKEATKVKTLSNQVNATTKANVDVDKLERDDALSVLAKQLKYLD